MKVYRFKKHKKKLKEESPFDILCDACCNEVCIEGDEIIFSGDFLEDDAWSNVCSRCGKTQEEECLES